MLKRPTRPLPRQFNRPLTQQTRTFVERRHQRARQHRQERWKRWMRRWRGIVGEGLSAAKRWVKFLVLGLAVFVLCLLLFSPILHVRGIRVIRTEGRVDLPAVLQALAPLYGRHLLLVSSHDIADTVRQVVPDAADVVVQKNYPSEILVRISVVPLVARVIIEAPSGADTSANPPAANNVRAGSGALNIVGGSGAIIGAPPSDFLTENGLLISTVHSALSKPLPVIRIVDWGARPVPMSPVLTPAFLDRMRRAEDALTLEFGQPIRMRTADLRAREFHLDSPTVSFWFDERSALEDQLERLRTFLGSVKLKELKSYVDLRLIGRVVYK